MIKNNVGDLVLVNMNDIKYSKKEIELLEVIEKSEFDRIYQLDDTITIDNFKCGWVSNDKKYGFSRKLIQDSVKIVIALGYKKSDIAFMVPLSNGPGFMQIEHIRIIIAHYNLQ